MLGCGLVYLYTQHRQSPYVAAKSLVIPAPLLALGSGRALMRRLEGADWRSLRDVAVAAVGIVLPVCRFASSYLVLRDAQVGPDDHIRELRSLRPAAARPPHARPFLRRLSPVGAAGRPVVLAAGSGPPIPAPVQAAKPWTYGQALDFDSVDAATLDRFDYVITTRTTAQSEPPSELPPGRTIPARTRSGSAVGPTQPRRVLAESGQPGRGPRLPKPAGLAPVTQPGRGAGPRRRPSHRPPLAPLGPGRSTQVQLRLAAGPRGTCRCPFVSPQAITVRGGGLDVRLPPNLDRPGASGRWAA